MLKFIGSTQICFLFAITCAFGIPAPSYAVFSIEEHFPNYFAELPLNQAEEKINKAIASILRRLELPYLMSEGDASLPLIASASEVQTSGFFEVLNIEVTAIDPDAQVYIAGGVVRSILGYLYQKIHHYRNNSPKCIPGLTVGGEDCGDRSVGAILDRIATKESGLIPLKALGLASDLDVVIIPSPSHEAKFEEMKERALKLINSAESFAHLRSDSSKLKYAVVPVGDVKHYVKQIDSATSQGGSTIDWLAYPVIGGTMISPAIYPNVFREFIQGIYNYLPPRDSALVRDADKQAVRALRPLVELPFLRLHPEGEALLSEDLDQIIQKVEKGKSLSSSALEQFEKLIRNARFGGAHNRFFMSEERVERKALALSKVAQKRDRSLPVIPEFLDLIPVRDPRKLSDHLLLTQSEFIKKFTHEGILYHGTPNVENILLMIRNGLVVSNSTQGNAASGRGAYTTQTESIAGIYAGIEGSVLHFELVQDRPLVILDWNQVKRDPEIQAIVEEAQVQNRDPFEYLARVYGVDIIVNEHVLIQNSSALKTPKNLSDLITFYSNRLESQIRIYQLNPSQLAPRFLEELQQYKNMYNLVSVIQKKKDLKRPQELRVEALLAFGVPFGSHELEESTQTDEKFLIHLFHCNDPKVRILGLKQFESYFVPEKYEWIKKFLHDPDLDIQDEAVVQFMNYAGSSFLENDEIAQFREILGNDRKFAQVKEYFRPNRHYGPSYGRSLLIEEMIRYSREEVELLGLSRVQELSSPQREDWVSKLLVDPRPSVRMALLPSGGYSPSETLNDIIAQLLRDSVLEVRVAAVRAFSAYDRSDKIDIYLHLLQNTEAEVRLAAVKSVHILEEVQKNQTIRDLLNDLDPRVRIEMLKTGLWHYTGSDKKKLIIELLQDPSPEVAMQALREGRTLPFKIKEAVALRLLMSSFDFSVSDKMDLLGQLLPMELFETEDRAVQNAIEFLLNHPLNEIQQVSAETFSTHGLMDSCLKNYEYIEQSGPTPTIRQNPVEMSSQTTTKFWKNLMKSTDSALRVRAAQKFKECYGHPIEE